MAKRKTPYSFDIRLRAFRVREASGPQMTRSLDFYEQFKEIVGLDREMFHVVTLDQKHYVIDRHIVSIGTLTASLVHPREVFFTAIQDRAAAVAFVHNHPSGDPTPSLEDRSITTRLKQAGELLGIRVLDHVIIGRERHFSFQEQGLL